MSIQGLPRVKDWLTQFDWPERYLAEHLVKKLRYVSFEELEKWIQSSVNDLLVELEHRYGTKETVAVFPVTKPFIHKFNKEKEIKPPSDSSGRIAHALKNLERRLPRHTMELSPRVESMRDRKVRHIVFVDDYIGTGDRFLKFWKEEVPPSVKAWCSLGWCKVWILVYAGHQNGLDRLAHRIRPVLRERIRPGIEMQGSFISENKNLASLVKKHGESLSLGRASEGYGKLLSPIVFQHGCPNNAPGLLWCSSVRGKKRWRPLFPDRSVPDDLYPLFGKDWSSESTAEELWMVGHYQLALEFLTRQEDYRGEHKQLMLLAFLDRGKKLDMIRSVMVLSERELRALLDELIKYGLTNGEYRVTGFGKDVLKRGGNEKVKITKKEGSYTNFYPASFLGFQREV